MSARRRPGPDTSVPELPLARDGAPSGEYRRARSFDAIAAVRPPPPSGRMLDDDITFEAEDDVTLELEAMPSSHRARPAAPALATRDAPPPSAKPAVRPPSASGPAIDPHTAVAAFAGFGGPPASLWATPGYALRVVLRRRTLRADLSLARRRSSRDVGVYESALRAADEGSVRRGFTLVAVLVVLAVALVFAIIHVVVG